MRHEDGGATIIVPLELQKNDTVTWYSGYDLIDVTPQELATVAKYPWAQCAASVGIDRITERMNSGRSRLINLLDSRIQNAENSLIEDFNERLYSTGKYNESQSTKIVAGLQAIVPEDPDSYDLGGVDASVQTTWRNKARGDSGTAMTWLPDIGDTPAKATGPAHMSHLYNCTSKGAGGSPDMIVTGQFMYEEYESGLHPMKRYGGNKDAAAAGFDTLRFRGATLFWDEHTASASVTAATGAASAIVAYFLNTKFIELVTDSQTDFIRTDFVRPENQDARTCLILWYGNMTCSARRKQGVLTDGNITDID